MPPSLANLIPITQGAALSRPEDSSSHYLDALERRLADRMNRLRRLSAIRIAVYAAVARTEGRR